MKNYSLIPSEQNTCNSLFKNSIGRNGYLFQFVDLLESISDCCTIGLNGEWGSGKTFFVKQLKLILDASNSVTPMDEEKREKIINLTKSRLPNVGSYSTLYYDAWAHDNDEDPLLSLMYTAIASGQSDYDEMKKRDLGDCVAGLVEILSERSVGVFAHALRGTDLFEKTKESYDIRERVYQFINTLIEEKGNRLVIFVDELDRCKPDFAVRFLERIKHYFDDKRVVFIFSVSISQLQYTIKAYYGSEFDATRYLDKFFDLRLSLPTISPEKYMVSQLGVNSSDIIGKVCIETAKYFCFSLREMERYVRLVQIVICPAVERLNPNVAYNNSSIFAFCYIMPVLMALQVVNTTDYLEFISGRNCTAFCEILDSITSYLRIDLIVTSSEHYDEATRTIVSNKDNTPVESLEARLKTIYSAIFSKSHASSTEVITVGKIQITEKVKRNIDEAISLLYPYSNYYFE